MATINRSQDPSDIIIDRAVITSDRLSAFYDITNNVVEISIYESLHRLEIFGDILILDDAALVESIDFQGQENLRLSLRFPDENAKLFTRDFICTAIIATAPGTNDQNQTVRIALQDVDSFKNNLICVNKKYDGNPRQIISQIMTDNFRGKKLFTNDNIFQCAMRTIIPNWTPYQAMKWVAQRSTSPSGAPFFCYSVHGDRHTRFFDLETMLGQAQTGATYRYSTSLANEMETLSRQQQSYLIKGFKTGVQENTAIQVQSGNVGAQYGFLDTQNFYDNSFKFDITKVFQSMLRRTKIVTDRKSPVYDARFKVEDKTMHSYRSRNMMQIGTTSIYNDIPGFFEDVTPEHHSTKAISKALRGFLSKSEMQITVSGRNFFYPGDFLTSSIGSIVNLEFMDTNPIYRGGDHTGHMDMKRSGQYLMSACRHLIKKRGPDAKVTTIAKVVKLSNTEGTARLR